VSRINHDKLAEAPRYLATAFYALIVVALIAALAGSLRFAFVLLIAGGLIHAARVGVEELLTTPARRSPGVNRRG
jgi:hypothetical protein